MAKKAAPAKTRAAGKARQDSAAGPLAARMRQLIEALPFDPARCWRHPLTQQGAAVLGLGLLLVGAGWWMERAAAEEPRFRVQVSDALLTQNAIDEWVTGDWNARLTAAIGAELRQSLGPDREFRLIDDDTAPAVFEGYARCPWVRTVHRVVRVFPNILRASFELRRPFVAVPGAGGFHLVDEEGVVLPLFLESAAELESLNADLAAPVQTVRGVEGAPPAAPGRTWPDPALGAALDLERALRAEGFYRIAPIVALEASAYAARESGGDRFLTVVLGAGGREVPVRFGNPPRAPGYREPDLATKYRNLAALLDANPELQGVRSIDLRFADPIVPLDRP